MLDFLWGAKNEVEECVEEAINAENEGRILKYYKLLEYFTAEKLDAQGFIDHSRKIFRAGMDGLKFMNFANLVLMLCNFCEYKFLNEIIEGKILHLLLETLTSMSRLNNIASKKLAALIKFADSRSSSIFLNHPLLIDLNPEDFQAKSWVPEASFDELIQVSTYLRDKYTKDQRLRRIKCSIKRDTDAGKMYEAKLQVEAYTKGLKRDHAFFQDVAQSFLPLKKMTNPLDSLLNQTEEISANINDLLQRYSGQETYLVLEKNFTERYHKKVDKEGIEARIDSATDQKQFETIQLEISPLISNIEQDYQILNDLSKRENIQKSLDKSVTQIFEWSQRIKKQIDDLLKAFSEVEPEDHHFQLSAEAQTRSILASSSGFASLSETKALPTEPFQCAYCDKVLYSEGFLQSHLNLEHAELLK